MALRYFFNEDEFGGPVKGLDDAGEHFWAGVLCCGAPVALAATLAAGALSTQLAAQVAAPATDEVAALAPDEDYAPTVLKIQQWHSAWYAGTAPSATPIAAEDDTWQLWLSLPPTDAPLYLVAPWAWGSNADDLATVGNTIAPAEEDFWTNPIPLAPVLFLYPAPWVSDDDIVTAPVPPDEDFWVNPVAPVQWRYAPLWPSALDPQDELSVPGQPDEDFWTSGVAPLCYALAPLPVWAWDPQDEQAFGLVPPPPVVVPMLLWVNPFLVQPHKVQPHAGAPFPTIGPN